MVRALKTVCTLIIFFSLTGCSSAPAEDRNPASLYTLLESSALWTLVHNECVPNQREKNDPRPCVAVDLTHGESKGYALRKDLSGTSHFLLVPTARITGIEDPLLRNISTPNYWSPAWRASPLVGQALRKNLARNQVGLVMNSIFARTQNQLHIHIDCLIPDLTSRLNQLYPSVGANWGNTSMSIEGVPFRIRRIEAETLDGINPFLLLAADLGKNIDKIQSHALAVIGAIFPNGKNGFYILDGYKSGMYLGRSASGDLLLDRSCAVAR